MGALFIFLIVVIIAGVLVYTIIQQRKTDESWRKAATRLDLNFTPSGIFTNRELTGKYRGYLIKVWTFSRGGKHQTYYTAAEVSLHSLPVKLEVKQKDFLQSVGTFLGAQDVKIGHPDFDENVVVKGSSPERIREYLTDERAAAINRFFRSFPGGEVTNDKLYAERQSIVDMASEVVSIVRQVTRLARLLEEERTDDEQEADRQFQKGSEAQDRGELPAAKEAYEKSRNRDPDNVDALVRSAGIDYMNKEYQSAAESYEKAVERDPNDPLIRKNFKRAARKANRSEEEIQDVLENHVTEPDRDQSIPGRKEPDRTSNQQESEKKPEPANDADQSPVAEPTDEPGSTEQPFSSDEPFRESADTADSTEQQDETAIGDVSVDRDEKAQSEPQNEPSRTKRSEEQVSDESVEEAEQKEPEPSTPDRLDEPDAPEHSPDQQQAIKELFDSGATSLDAGERFEEQYEGRTVEWEGEFLERKDLSLSLQFDDDREGDLIRVRLHRGGQGTTVKRDCYGFIHFPSGFPNYVDRKDSVRFRGTLFRIDEFMRNLYISDASLLE